MAGVRKCDVYENLFYQGLFARTWKHEGCTMEYIHRGSLRSGENRLCAV
jgi:hypothetical protein